MATANGNTFLKQIKTLPVERINGKVKLSTKAESNGSASANAQSSTVGKGANAQQGEGLSPEQRRRASGRQLMTPEEQKIQLRKRVYLALFIVANIKVEQFIPTINGISVLVLPLTCIVRNSTTNILAKYKEATPSLVVHLYPTHFRFDQQVCCPYYILMSGGRILLQQSHEG